MSGNDDTRFVRSKSGAVYRLTPMNSKSSRMQPISDVEALMFFREQGADLEALGLAELNEAYEAQRKAKADQKAKEALAKAEAKKAEDDKKAEEAAQKAAQQRAAAAKAGGKAAE